MVDDEGAGNVRIDLRRVSSALHHRITHGGEVHEDRHAREVLEEHARGHELDLTLPPGKAGRDNRECLPNGILCRGRTTHDVLQKHEEGTRQTCGTGDSRNVVHESRHASCGEFARSARGEDGIMESAIDGHFRSSR